MISVSVGEAKNKLTYFLHLVEDNGESIQITRHGKTVAVINNQEAFNSLDKKQQFKNCLAKCILVTRNVKDYEDIKKVSSLMIENWFEA